MSFCFLEEWNNKVCSVWMFQSCTGACESTVSSHMLTASARCGSVGENATVGTGANLVTQSLIKHHCTDHSFKQGGTRAPLRSITCSEMSFLYSEVWVFSINILSLTAFNCLLQCQTHNHSYFQPDVPDCSVRLPLPSGDAEDATSALHRHTLLHHG